MKRPEARILQKNDIRTCEITDFGENGEGIGRADGIPVFVSGAVIGDTVKIKITKVKKKMAYARTEEIIKASPDRIKPPCPVAARCGGCQIMSHAYPAQLKYKEQKVRTLLQRIGHFDVEEIDAVLQPVSGMEEPYRFRNKAQVPVGAASAKTKTGTADASVLAEGRVSLDRQEVITGYYATHSHRIVPHEDCVIGNELNAKILRVVRDHMMQYDIPPYDEETHTGLVRHVLTRRGGQTGEVMVCLVLNRRADALRGETSPEQGGTADAPEEKIIPAQDRLTEALQRCLEASSLASVCVNFNPQRTNVILGNETRTIHGKPYIEDVLCGLRFRISAPSFYQTNPYMTERLYTGIANRIRDINPVIWDLYCGIGTISLTIARRHEHSHIYGIEIIPQAIEDAKENARINGIENVTFLCADVAEAKNLPRPDIIIVDPPRKGCDRALLNTILTASPAHIIYVSCDPATLSRDLRILADGGYKPISIQPYDMFPHSVHVETVVYLSKLKSDEHVKVEVDMSEFEK